MSERLNQQFNGSGKYNDYIPDEYRGILMTIKYGWMVGKYIIVAIFGMLLWLGAHGWFVSAAKQTDLDKISSQLEDTNKKLQRHDQMFDNLIAFTNEMRLSMGRIEGKLGIPPPSQDPATQTQPSYLFSPKAK